MVRALMAKTLFVLSILLSAQALAFDVDGLSYTVKSDSDSQQEAAVLLLLLGKTEVASPFLVSSASHCDFAWIDERATLECYTELGNPSRYESQDRAPDEAYYLNIYLLPDELGNTRFKSKYWWAEGGPWITKSTGARWGILETVSTSIDSINPHFIPRRVQTKYHYPENQPGTFTKTEIVCWGDDEPGNDQLFRYTTEYVADVAGDTLSEAIAFSLCPGPSMVHTVNDLTKESSFLYQCVQAEMSFEECFPDKR